MDRWRRPVSHQDLQSALAGAVFALCLVALWVHARTYLPFMVDDAFISLRYSWRLLHGHGLTWTDGERVEGYSNLLWILLVAAGGLVQPNLVSVARVLAFAATAVAFGLLLFAGLRRRGYAAVVFSGAAALALALCGPMAAWSVAGMEQPLVAALVLAAALGADSLLSAKTEPSPASTLALSLPLGLLCLLRPDGGIFTVAAVLALWCGRGTSRATIRLALWVVLPPTLCTLAQLAFRGIYYESLWPNTFYVKGRFSRVRVGQGWQYIHRSLKPLAALWASGLLTVALAVVSPELRRRIWFPLFALLLWLAYLLRVGGDIFPQRRQLLVVFALLAFLLLHLLLWLWERRHVMRFCAPLLVPALLAWLVVAQKGDLGRTFALIDTAHWSGAPVGQFLRKAFQRQRPLLAVDAAGALPYFYQLPCLDMLGLNDRHIARKPPSDFGTGFIGHELGDGRYVLSRKPDLVAFWTPVGGKRPRYRSGQEMVQEPEFHRVYQAITFETDDASRTQTTLWLRRRDGRLGVQTSSDRIEIPGYLLDGTNHPVRLDAEGRLYASLHPNSLAFVRSLRLPPGRLAIRVASSGPGPVQVHVGGRPLAMNEDGTFALDAGTSAPTEVDVALVAEAPTRAFGLVITPRPTGER